MGPSKEVNVMMNYIGIFQRNPHVSFCFSSTSADIYGKTLLWVNKDRKEELSLKTD